MSTSSFSTFEARNMSFLKPTTISVDIAILLFLSTYDFAVSCVGAQLHLGPAGAVCYHEPKPSVGADFALGYLNDCGLAWTHSSRTIIASASLKVTLQDLTARLSSLVICDALRGLVRGRLQCAAPSIPIAITSFGQQILVLRTASNLTQSGLAELLGVSRQAVVGWEAGSSRPSPQHLKHFIELCLQHNAFHSGQEAAEIRALWQNSRVRVPLDETWLTRLLEKQPESPPAPTPLPHAPGAGAAPLQPGPLVDWGDAPEGPSFYGRESELALLTDWLLEQHCRVVSILGMGGIGKSALAVTLMHRVADQFDAVIWRSLRDAPPCEPLLDEMLRILAGEPLTIVLDSLERRLTLLFEYLRTRRVLLVLDNLESVMEEAEGSGRMLPGYEGYGRLLRRAAETKHNSCLLLTSREKPMELAPLEGNRTPVRSLHLGQLDAERVQSCCLQEKEVTGSAAGTRTLD